MKNMVRNYGLTDPKPVIRKFNKVDEECLKTCRNAIAECQKAISQRKVEAKGKSFLSKHPKQ